MQTYCARTWVTEQQETGRGRDFTCSLRKMYHKAIPHVKENETALKFAINFQVCNAIIMS